MRPPSRRSVSVGIVLWGLVLAAGAPSAGAQVWEDSTSVQNAFTSGEFSQRPDTLDPKRVLRSSLLVPGMGQVRNGQWWKVPIIYAVLGTAVKYTSDLTIRYHDYRAAVYNLSLGEEGDGRFGPTPDYISPNSDPTQLKRVRDQFRNRRDFMFIAIGLLHGLNGLDAYVHAHMRDFDVSDDLSATVRLAPAADPVSGLPVPSLNLSIRVR